LDHGVTQLVGADGLFAAAQSRESLLQEAVRLTEREPSPSPSPSPFGALARRTAPRASVLRPPARATAVRTVFALARRFDVRESGLRRGAGDARPQRDLVLPVVQLGEVDETLVGRLHQIGRAS